MWWRAAQHLPWRLLSCLFYCSPFYFVVVIIHSIVDDTPLFSNEIKCFSWWAAFSLFHHADKPDIGKPTHVWIGREGKIDGEWHIRRTAIDVIYWNCVAGAGCMDTHIYISKGISPFCCRVFFRFPPQLRNNSISANSKQQKRTITTQFRFLYGASPCRPESEIPTKEKTTVWVRFELNFCFVFPGVVFFVFFPNWMAIILRGKSTT